MVAQSIANSGLAYQRCGDGAPVVLVHGVSTSSFIWQRMIPGLAARYDVIALDLLGFGRSPRDPAADMTVPAQAERVTRLIESLDVGAVHLVGHDVGGAIAQIVCARHPALVRDLSLLNTVGYDYWPVPVISALRAPIIRQLSFATLNRRTLRLIVERGLHHKERMTEELLEQFHGQIGAPEARKSFMRFIRALDNRSLDEVPRLLRESGKRVLIIRGDADAYLTARIAERLHQDLPGSRFVRVATAGHFLQEDEPEQVTAALAEFFESHD